MALYGMCGETEKMVKAIVDSMRAVIEYGHPVGVAHILDWADRLQLLYDPGLKLLQRMENARKNQSDDDHPHALPTYTLSSAEMDYVMALIRNRES